MAAMAAATLLTLTGAKPLAQYTGDEFFALVGGLRYGGGSDRQRRCRGNADCAGTRRISVHADAVVDADSLSPGNLPQYGIVAARALNHGSDTEARYGMQPSPRRTYYLVVLPAAGSATWTMEEMDVVGTTRSHRTVATGRLTLCNHPFVRGARADFKTCAQASGGAMPASFGFSMQGDDDPPLWISCASGCCTADAASRS
jgi:hypothetical protein